TCSSAWVPARGEYEHNRRNATRTRTPTCGRRSWGRRNRSRWSTAVRRWDLAAGGARGLRRSPARPPRPRPRGGLTAGTLARPATPGSRTPGPGGRVVLRAILAGRARYGRSVRAGVPRPGEHDGL